MRALAFHIERMTSFTFPLNNDTIADMEIGIYRVSRIRGNVVVGWDGIDDDIQSMPSAEGMEKPYCDKMIEEDGVED